MQGKKAKRNPDAESIEIRAQEGPQERFLSSPADIVIYGGSAGGGKTWSILLECLRHAHVKGFGAVIFRRTSPQITNEGGLWDESFKLYPLLGAQPSQSRHEWIFPPHNNCISFGHLQHDKTVHDWQGSQIPLICFDELCHFSEKQFFYMLSRNRSLCGVRPYIRATCNPDADSWVATFIRWWINQDTGLAIPERAGVVRWFIRLNDKITWGDSKEELLPMVPANLPPTVKPDDLIKSVTFIPSSIYDNKKLLETNPAYLGNLLALPLVERERLLGGNWKIKPTAGKVFNKDWFEIVDAIPAGGLECRFWDFAATEKEFAKDDPDFTAGVKVRMVNGVWFVTNVVAVQAGPAEVERLFLKTSREDAEQAKATGTRYKARWEQEPGSAGKRESFRLTKLLAGLDAKGVPSRGDKLTRAKPFAVQAEAGNVKVLRADWTQVFLTHLHGQPDLPHDDEMDAAAGAFQATVQDKATASTGKSIY